MSSLQDKLYNQKVVPPVNTWGKIAAVLDKAQSQNEFSTRLYNVEVIPPAKTWEKIIVALDESKLQNNFSTRLYKMEIAPPLKVWEKVTAGLSTTTGYVTPVRKFSPILRYAAAAVFIGAVAYGIIKMAVSTANNENSAVMSTIDKDSSTANKNKTNNSGKTQTTDINTSKDDSEVIEVNKTLLTKLDRPVKRLVRALASSIISRNNDDIVADEDLSQSIYAYTDHIPDIADRYVMLMTPDGNIIRMSKKWSDLLCCVSGEEQDADCKNQLKKWQEKIATSSLAPSPANFMDILGLINSLNDSNGL